MAWFREGVCAVGLVMAACDAKPVAPTRAPPDKAELFGDPTLVPTRSGEAARSELAIAGEIAALLRATRQFDSVHVDVEHRDDALHVIVAGRTNTSASAAIEAEVRKIVVAVGGEQARATLTLTPAPAPAPIPERRLDVPLGLALVGLGASVAVVLERFRLRYRRIKPRRGATTRT